MLNNINQPIHTPQGARNLFTQVAIIVNRGLVNERTQLNKRTWDRQDRGWVPSADINIEEDKFYKWYAQQVDNSETNPRITAALVEYHFNGKIHPLADGCSKVSSLLAGFTLLRNGDRLPVYRTREEHYHGMRNCDQNEWINYYLSLFDEV